MTTTKLYKKYGHDVKDAAPPPGRILFVRLQIGKQCKLAVFAAFRHCRLPQNRLLRTASPIPLEERHAADCAFLRNAEKESGMVNFLTMSDKIHPFIKLSQSFSLTNGLLMTLQQLLKEI